MKPANYAPVYCSLYPALAEIVRSHGYALAIHGTLGRDMDLICIPWTEQPSDPFAVVEAICKEFALRPAITDGGPAAKKLHGRMAYAIVFAGGGFIDLSFMPTTTRTRESLPPEILVSALQNTVHKSINPRVAKSKKVRTK